MTSIKTNFIYSSILTTANYIFPLITYPYVSRVLGVTNIGICNFVDSIINYFSMFSLMGIVAVGIRSIAAVKSDKEELSKYRVQYARVYRTNGDSLRERTG